MSATSQRAAILTFPAPKREVPKSAGRTAIDLYPDREREIADLKRVNIATVHGFFDRDAWEDVCAQTELYMLPTSGIARANYGPIREAGYQRDRRRIWPFFRASPEAEVINEMAAKGKLLPTLFPNFREDRSERYHIGFQVATPPADVLAVAQKARLAGYQTFTAVPAQGIKITELVDVQPVGQVIPSTLDPIVYAIKGKTVVVLTHYGDIPTESMKSLVDVLKGMDVRL